jgi:pimeloyl-ACP methyl ester carboxylesterase
MLIVETINSRHLAGNLLGDPSRRDLVVYLPPGYEEHGTRRYPSVYLLHGFGMKARWWAQWPADIEMYLPPIDEIFDPVILRGEARDVIVVAPDGWSSGGCSQWVDSPANGNFERYVTREVVDYVDHRFRTIPSAQSRGVFGISSGGLGAWHLGSRNPDVFGAMNLLSADAYFDLTHRPWIYRFYNSIYPNPPDGPIEGNFWSSLTYGLSQCYTPQPDNPPYYADLPIEFPSGDVIPHLWERWLSYDPIVSWRHRLDNLRRLRGILLDVGWNDQYYLHYGHRILSKRLAEASIAHDVEEHAGNHDSRLDERLKVSLRWFSKVLEQF